MDGTGYHIHFGPGKLAIGAVLPCIDQELPLAVVACAGDAETNDERDVDWTKACQFPDIRLANSAKSVASLNSTFACVRKARGSGHIYPSDLKGPRVLIVVDAWDQAVSILSTANSVSVSLGSAQVALEESLESAKRQNPAPLLSFENRTTLNRARLEKAGWVLHKIVTDRICPTRAPDKGYRKITVLCEEYLSVIAPKILRNCSTVISWESRKPEFTSSKRRT